MYALYPESAKFARVSQDVTNLNRDLISNYGYVDIEQTGFEAGNVSIACHVVHTKPHARDRSVPNNVISNLKFEKFSRIN